MLLALVLTMCMPIDVRGLHDRSPHRAPAKAEDMKPGKRQAIITLGGF